MITYLETMPAIAETITADHLHGFFTGWWRKPTPDALLRILRGSDHAVVAFDGEAGQVVGYITAISDGVSCAYIPHLEVLESRRGQGIGSALVRRLLEQLNNLYAIDLMCDADVQPFYARLGFQPSTGMIIRNYDRQQLD